MSMTIKTLLFALAFGALALVSSAKISLGAYDFAQTLGSNSLIYEETFINQVTGKGWANAKTEEGVYAFATSARSKGRTPIITIEPRCTGNPLDNVASGKCDPELARIAAELRRFGGTVIVRWGHECENPIYPWGAKDPALYVRAYRHVVEYLRAAVPQKLYFL